MWVYYENILDNIVRFISKSICILLLSFVTELLPLYQIKGVAFEQI